MFDQARAFFGLPSKSNKSLDAAAGELRSALAVVLIHAVTVDGSADHGELQVISHTINSKLQLPRDKIDSLLHDSFSDAGQQMLEQSLAEINEHFSLGHREQLFSLACSVLQADGKVGPGESVFAAHLRQQLGLSPESAARAREHAGTVKISGFKDFLEVSKALVESTSDLVVTHGNTKR